MSSCTPTTDCLLFQQCVLICGGRSTSLRGSWWVTSSLVLQPPLVFVMRSSYLYWVGKFWQGVEERRMKPSTFCIFKCLNHSRYPASAPPIALFLGCWGLMVCTNQCWHQWDLFLSPHAGCVWESQRWVFWDFLARSEGAAFLPSPPELACFSLCFVAQADVEVTGQKPSARQSMANKALHSSPAGQWLFCLTFACSWKWFIQNCSIFLVSFCTLNGQIFFSCNSVLDSLYPFVLFPVCTVMKRRCCVLEVKRAMKLSNMAHAVVIPHENQVSACIMCQNTTRKCAWVFALPLFVCGEAEA